MQFCRILQVMHDPMAMRPFMGYNFGKYLEHWMNLNTPERKVRCLVFWVVVDCLVGGPTPSNRYR